MPAIERRIRTELTEKAEEGAIQLFSDNLRNLLLVAPLKGRVVLGFDPAFRTGAKLAVVDATGKMLTTQVIYPVKPASARQIEEAKKDLADLIGQYGVEIIAIGNGTASRESEAFVAEVLKDFPEVSYVIVNESGASVYSASELARQEFPDLTVENALPFLSPVVCKILLRNWSKSILSQLVSVNTNTMSVRRNYLRVWTLLSIQWLTKLVSMSIQLAQLFFHT